MRKLLVPAWGAVGLRGCCLLLACAPWLAHAQVTATLSPSNLAFGNVTVTTDSVARNVTIANSSASLAFNVTALSIGSRYREVAGGSCGPRPFALAAGASCSVAVVFNPDSLGSFPGSFSVTTSPAAAFTPASVGLGGVGVPVLATLAPSTLAYGNVEIGATSAAQTATIANADPAATLTVSSISLSSRYFEVAGGSCPPRPFALAPNASCTVRVVFAPNSQGSFPGSLSVTTTPSSTFTPSSITIGGVGVPVPATLAPTTLAYGNVSIGTTSVAQTVTVANASTMSAPLTINTITISSRYSETSGGTCPARPFDLDAGESCTVRIVFNPDSQGSFPASFSVSTTPNSSFNPASVTIGGVGAPLPATLSPANLAFGNATVNTTTAPRLVTIANADPQGSFTVSAISLSSRYRIVDGGTCLLTPFALSAGASCTLAVVFEPNSLGSFPAFLSISTAPATSVTPSSVTIAGTGTPVPALFEPASLAFGNVVVGDLSPPRSVSLANADPAASLTVSSVSLSSRYSVVGGSCGNVPFVLDAGASCDLVIRFSPNSLGSFPAFLSVGTTPSSTFAPAQVSISGTGAVAALFSDGFEP
jgi:hypothetical protein